MIISVLILISSPYYSLKIFLKVLNSCVACLFKNESYLIDFNRTDNYNFDVYVKSIEQLVFPETNFETVLS